MSRQQPSALSREEPLWTGKMIRASRFSDEDKYSIEMEPWDPQEMLRRPYKAQIFPNCDHISTFLWIEYQMLDVIDDFSDGALFRSVFSSFFVSFSAFETVPFPSAALLHSSIELHIPFSESMCIVSMFGSLGFSI
jgi:hypothetical protein